MYITINKNIDEVLYLQVYKQIKNGIINGTIKAGSKLPSIRKLVIDLGVSKTTIENAYNQLLMEGYIEGIERSGFFVVKLDDKYIITTDKEVKPIDINIKTYKNIGITEDIFNFKKWQKEINKVITHNDSELLNSSSVNGEELLREEIIKYTSQYRGVKAHKNQVIVGAGIQQLLGILINLIEDPKVAFEYPGYERVKYILESYKTHTVPIQIEENGININSLTTTKANIVYVSPSHQYPTGNIMSISKRLELIKWAKENENYIIEDDYNSILRYSGNPIPSLQGLGVDRVIYIGSFSTVLFPSLKISYMILPTKLIKTFESTKYKFSQTASKIEQLALSNFMKDGDFERHIRRVRKMYSKKNDIIIDEIDNLNLEGVKVLATKAGTHLLLEFDDEKNLKKVKQNALLLNLKIENVIKGKNRVIFKYTGIKNQEIKSVMASLFDI